MPLLDLLAPPRCVACLGRGGPVWCRACLDEVQWLRGQVACPRCASPGRSHGCWPDWVPICSATALARYAGPVASAVVAGKVQGATAVWRHLGSWLGSCVEVEGHDLVTAVPSDRRRVRARGHDHGPLLGAAVAARVRAPHRTLLEPVGRLPDRGQADDGVRLAAPRFRPRGRFPDGRVLLVDDVLTSGTTIAAAAVALAAAGVSRIDVAVVGRAGRSLDVVA